MTPPAEDAAAERITELVSYLRHTPGCPVGEGRLGACVCGLDGVLDDLHAHHGLTVIRCRGCHCHEVTPDGTEDWAYRGRENEPYCHGCYEAIADPA